MRWIPLQSIVSHQCESRVVPICLSSELMAVAKQSIPDARPGGIRLAWVPSVGWWLCGLRMKCNRSPDAQLGSFWLGLGDCGSSMYKNTIRPFNLWYEF